MNWNSPTTGCKLKHWILYILGTLPLTRIWFVLINEIFPLKSTTHIVIISYKFYLVNYFFKNIFYFYFIIHILFCQEKNFISLFSLYSIILNLLTRCFWLNLTQNIFLLTNLFVYSIIYYGESVFFDKNNKLTEMI